MSEPTQKEKKLWRVDPVTWRFLAYLNKQSELSYQKADDTLMPGGSREIGLVEKAKGDLYRDIFDVIEEGSWSGERPFEKVSGEKPFFPERGREEVMALLAKKVVDLALPTRVQTIFARYEIQTVRDVVAKTASELLKMKAFGRGSLKSVEKVLQEMGFDLNLDLQNFLEP